MKCPKCGTDNEVGFRFCVKCGANLEYPLDTDIEKVDMGGYYSEDDPVSGGFIFGSGTFKISADPVSDQDSDLYTADELKESGVNVDGSEPEGNSWVAVVDNKVVDGCLQFDDYMVNVEYNYVSDAVKGQCASVDSWTQTIYPTILKSAGGTAYYASEWIKANPVFYNPVTNSSKGTPARL